MMPQRISYLDSLRVNVTQVACGTSHTLFLTDHGVSSMEIHLSFLISLFNEHEITLFVFTAFSYLPRGRLILVNLDLGLRSSGRNILN